MTTLTVLTPGDQAEIESETEDGAVLVDPGDLGPALGWELTPEGLCRGDVCVPTPDGSGVRRGARVDLVATAVLLGCTTLLDADGAALAVSVPHHDRQRALRGREAPGFTLPDLDGALHTLESFHDRKRLLVAFASW